MLTTRIFLSTWLCSVRPGAGSRGRISKESLRGAPDRADLAARIGGELLGRLPGVPGRLGQHLRLDVVELGKQVRRATGVGEHHALLDQLAGLPVELGDPIDLLGAHDHGLGDDEAILVDALRPVGLGQQVGHLDPLGLDRPGFDAVPGQEPGDRAEVGVDLILDSGEVGAGRGDPQGPDREIGLDESLGQALDRDEAIGGATQLEAAADQEAGAEQAEPQDQRAEDQGPGRRAARRAF